MARHKNVDCADCETREKGIFCSMQMPELESLTKNKITNTYKKGYTIFFQGIPPFGLYCLKSGKVKLSQAGDDGKELIIRIAQEGDIIGHRSLFSHQNYHASAVALEDSVICFIDKNHIFELIQRNPGVALKIIERLSLEMGAAEKRSSSLFRKNVRERMAEIFLWLRQTFGVDCEDGRIKLNITLTREELASMIGTASETVIRSISEFKAEGIIQQEGKTIFILNEEKLIEFANLNH